MNAFANYSVNVVKTLTTLKLCGANESEFLYLAELHVGCTSRGPLNFKPGLYLRNGTSKKDPIFAAAGDISVQPVFVSAFNLNSAIMLPSLDLEVNPGDLVTEVMHASTTTNHEHVVAFRLSVEVGIKRSEREEFEWRKVRSDGTDTRSRYILLRLPSSSSSSSASSPQSSSANGSHQLAELVFTNLTSLKHIFTLELKEAGRTGELGERWSLMVVMTALRLWWLRQYGRTRKATVGIAEKVRGK
jgi:hypothetical protein